MLILNRGNTEAQRKYGLLSAVYSKISFIIQPEDTEENPVLCALYFYM
jgi:uncharacterized protein Veg